MLPKVAVRLMWLQILYLLTVNADGAVVNNNKRRVVEENDGVAGKENIENGAAGKENNEMVIRYLQRYGYLNETFDKLANSEDSFVLQHAISLFQEYYKLPVTGTINNETLNLMSKARCGLGDIANFGEEGQRKERRWPKKHLTWNFHLANKPLLDTTRAAFDICQIILLSWRAAHHTFVESRNGEVCTNPFDGPGGTLAHAFYPNGAPDYTSEIHVDKTEPWYIHLDTCPADKAYLLYLLTHEIGHALGLDHSTNNASIMYSFAPVDPRPVALSNEDILNIHNLYGATDTDVLPKRNPMPPPSPHPTPNAPPDLCALKRVDAILLLERRMYVAYGKHIWAIDIDGKTYSEPMLLSNYMPFIHSNFTRISAAYQTPSDHLILFVDDKIYKVNYPDFTLVSTWPRTFREFGIPMNAKINAAVNTNKGKSYVVYDGYLVGEIDDCSNSISKFHTIESIFPGIPNGVTSIFRYIDGNLYFTTRRQFYKFNEFKKTVLTAGTFDLRIVNIICPRYDLLKQLRDLLYRIARPSNILTNDDDDDDDYY
ncbi:PREDICTED: matrix metalloproteinase-18-like [Vollenhovia emeryi]|uniref:matrix metalloproteinase-18-like n=1 Tax=Vollenhovia emeryi TaxID=411798 RepID=UPI0005F43C23|nr:PREDICTED: matrix metalloproteinase-18-like [Vollenhovia emeryi]